MTDFPRTHVGGISLPRLIVGTNWFLREQDMVTIGTTTADEAEEVIEISRALLEKRKSEVELQKTRSKQSLK